MNRDKLKDIMRFHGVKSPYRGTGIGGKVTNQDLEDALGDYFYAKKVFTNLLEDAKHMALRRTVRPMKAYRFNNLKEDEQQSLFDDDNGWIAERKYDGWRIIITHLPGSRLHFFGGNLSTTEFLPVDYTYHLPEMWLDSDDVFMLDTEATCDDTVIQQDGYPSTNTREAVAAILGASVEVAQAAQEDAIVDFAVFDAMLFEDGVMKPMSLAARKKWLKTELEPRLVDTEIYLSYWHYKNKKRFLNQVWKEGGEGIILKNLSAPYDSGGRKRTHCVKVKKSASSLIGDTIDAYISGYTLTDVHSFNDLIGGLELSVSVNDEPTVIATVTNMPDHLRHALTMMKDGLPALVPEAYGKVLEIDGQEFSTRNRKLMHAAVVNWEFRKDKSPVDCIMTEADFGGKF